MTRILTSQFIKTNALTPINFEHSKIIHVTIIIFVLFSQPGLRMSP